MKNIRHLLLSAFCTCLAMSAAFGQKIDEREVEFGYQRLPMRPIKGGGKTFQSNVVLGYEEAILAQKAAEQREYEAALAAYPQTLKAAEEAYAAVQKKYEEDMKAWNEKSMASKIVEREILNENNKPVPPPPFYPPAKPYLFEAPHEKIFSKDMLASTYLNLDGYSKAPGGISITATLFGFSAVGPDLKQGEFSEYNTKTQTTVKMIKYWYETQYKHPINLKVLGPNGEVVVDETFSHFNEYSKAKTVENQGSAPAMDRQSYMDGLQNKIVESNMTEIRDYLQDNFGYSKVNRKVQVNRVESKQQNYDDYQKAFELASEGYSQLLSNVGTAKSKLLEAVDIWEKALKESNPSDKKARINGEVTIATLFNLGEAYVWLNQYTEASGSLNRIIGLSPSKKEKKLVDEMLDFVKDQKLRFEANM